MLKMMVMFQQALRPVKNEKGATAVEYGLLVALIAAVIVGTVTVVGTKVLAGFEAVNAVL
jgi:pilus assembly protein Flp/PilA